MQQTACSCGVAVEHEIVILVKGIAVVPEYYDVFLCGHTFLGIDDEIGKVLRVLKPEGNICHLATLHSPRCHVEEPRTLSLLVILVGLGEFHQSRKLHFLVVAHSFNLLQVEEEVLVKIASATSVKKDGVVGKFLRRRVGVVADVVVVTARCES